MAKLTDAQKRKKRQYKQKQKRYEKKQEWEKYQPEDLPPDLPFDAELERQLSQYQLQGDRAGIEANEAKANLFNLNFDPNNPFSNQAMLQKNLADQFKSTQLDFGKTAGGIYSGALEATQSENAFQGQKAQDALNRSYFSDLGDINRGYADTIADIGSQSDDLIWQQAVAHADNWEATTPFSRLATSPKPKGGNKKPRKPKFMRR